MKKLIMTLLSISLIVFHASPSQSAFLNGNALYEECQNNSGRCIWYIMGLIDMSELLPELYCLPSGATSGQIHDIVVTWIQERPAERHNFAADLFLDAMIDAFPC